MEQQLKQRLVGVAVIFSLAIIFLPMLLDGSGNRPKHLEISIPVPPQVPSYEIVEEKVIELKKKVEELPELKPLIVDEISDPPAKQEVATKQVEPVKPQKQSKTVEPDKADKPVVVKKETKEKTEVKKEPIKKQVGGLSWVIQIGSFSEKNKAYKQRDRLRKSGLAAVFIEKFKHEGKLSYRVRMGPFITREKAKVIGNKVRAKYNIKGLVMRYEK